jgi:DNA-binding YbaB/EbfC family protein
MTDNPNMVGMLKQLREMQKDLAKAQKDLAKETVSAEAGNGAVSVTITGDQKITHLVIDADLLASNDAKKISSLTMEAINKALEDSRTMAQDRLGPLANGISL